MLRRGRGRPKKHACSDRTLTSSQKHLARQLGKRAIPSLYPFCQQRGSGALADCRVSSHCGQGHVDWNSSGCGDFASALGGALRSRANEDNDAHVDQWVGVEVILCGRKSSIGEVGSTTSNVCDELRSVIADPGREHLCASFSKNRNLASNVEPKVRTTIANRREEEEGRVWPSATKHGVVPSWSLSCRRNMTRKRRINASGGISDCHITALIASLPKTWSHIGGKATSTRTIASTEANGLHLCADEGAVISVDQSSEAAIPMEQSLASQESNVNSGQGSSLDFGHEKQVDICVLQSNPIQVCPTTPEKAQKRRRHYQDTVPDLSERGMNGWEPSNDGVTIVSKFSTKVGAGVSDLCPPADDNSGKDAGGGLALTTDFILSPCSVEFESSCNSTGIGDPGLNAGTGVDHPRLLVNSIPTPAMAGPFDSVSHVASVISDTIVNAVRESAQLFQTQVPSTTVFDMDSNRRREEHVRFKLHQTVGGRTAIAPKVRKKYKPRVAKEKATHNSYGSRVQNRTAGNRMDHAAVFKHGRAEVVRHEITRDSGAHRDTSARDSYTSHSDFRTNYTGTVGESRSLLYPEDATELRIGQSRSIPVISRSPREVISSVENPCLTRSVLEEDVPSNLEHFDRIVDSHSVWCTESCELEQGVTCNGSPEIGQTEQMINNLSSSSEDHLISKSVNVRMQEESIEVLSVALANRVLALLGLPSSGQSRSTAGEDERSPSMQASNFVRCYAEAALRKCVLGDDFASFCEEWSAKPHSVLELSALDALSAEMAALDALPPERTTPDASNEVQAIDFDLFYKDHLSAGSLEDTLLQTLNAELNEYECGTIVGTSGVRGSQSPEDQRGEQDVLCATHCGIEETGLVPVEQSYNPCPSPVWRPLMVFSESSEDGTMSSFYASTSAGVNNIMLSRLNEMIEQNIQQNVQQSDTWNTDHAGKALSMHVMPDCGPDANFATGCCIVAAEVSSELEDSCSDYIVPPENAPLNQACPRQKICLVKTPFHLMTNVQLVAYIKIILSISSEMLPVQLLRHVQDHLPGEEKVEFEKLWPMILHFVSREQLKKLADLAEIDLPPCLQEVQQMHGTVNDDSQVLAPSSIVVIQDEQTLRRCGAGANDGNHLPPSYMEAFQCQQKKEDNHVTALVPYVGNVGDAMVAYDGHFFPQQRFRKPRPKVYLDTETIRAWKLLMGKTETTEHDPDTMGNKLKWNRERLLMQEQAESFIRRMHLIQGDRSFSRWKGSIVDSVVGVFLTQNVSDVLSSSAFMSLRARFPSPGFRRPLQSKSPGGDIGDMILQNGVQYNIPTPIIQTGLQEPPDRPCNLHEASFNCAPVSSLSADECGQDMIPTSQESCHAKSNTSSDPEIKQVGSSLSLGSESRASLLTSDICQQEGSALYSQPERQPPTTGTVSLNVSEMTPELNVRSIMSHAKCHEIHTNASDLEIVREHTGFLSGSESQGSLTSFLEKEANMMHSYNSVRNNFEFSTCCITNAECNLTEETVMMPSLESQLELTLYETSSPNGVNCTDHNNLIKELPNEEKLSTGNVLLTGPERARMEAEQVRAQKSLKWEALAEKYRHVRCQQAAMDLAPPRTEMTQDGVDWEAVRCADLEEIADAIKERGMNWKLAGRIKGFLERLQLEQGGIDLEWLRSIPSDDAKEFLSSVHGLGLKSVECIRLLALHHNAFPVDTNVGRICVRLGWVPLEPLPEELQLHVLELYPVQATIQKYLWPRLCTLDQQTLYELHYQLITFGKVFCTKSKPNCNACPMRSDCKHFASALSSAKLALPASDHRASGGGAILALPPGTCSAAEVVAEGTAQPSKTVQSSMCMSQYCQPIIEEPMTPESEADMSDCDIEDYPFSVEEIGSHASAMELYLLERQDSTMHPHVNNPNCCCKLNLGSTLSESEVVQEMDMADSKTGPAREEAQLQVVNTSLQESAHMVTECDGEGGKFANMLTRSTVLFSDHAPVSREVVMLPPGADSTSVPKLKIIERLRTVHYVYELPDNHPLLDGMDIREADDPCFYLLAIWSPGEVPESIPNINDDNEESTSFAFFNLNPNDEESIKCTLLVPCRTAMRGSFPLNGTYFQVNEVFADHESSLQPILVPRELLWNLRCRYVYFGTSVTSILRGMTTEEIQACFRRGYVCVRGFDRMTRAPKPLVGRLHFQTTKSISKSAQFMKNTKP